MTTLPWAFGLFFGAAVITVAAAIGLATAGDIIAARTRMGRLWVGTLLLAGATSLPELVTSITAVRIDAPDLAVGDVLGANMLNMSNLALLILILGGRNFFEKILPQQVLVAVFAIFMTLIATVLLLWEPQAKWLGMSPVLGIIIGAYLVGAWFLKKSAGESSDSEEPPPMRSLRWGWIVFGISALVIFGSAPFLASSAEAIAEQTGVSESFFGVLAVAFVTTLPELTTSAAALRLGARDLAVANIFGTNAFNILVLGIADPFFTQGSFFASVDDSQRIAGGFAVLLMALMMTPIALKRQRLGPFPFIGAGTAVIVAIYLLGLFLVFQAGN